MIDIQFIRDNPDLVKQKSSQKGYDIDVSRLLELDSKRRELLTQSEDLRRQRNEIAQTTKGGPPDQQQIDSGKKLKEESAKIDQQLAETEEQFFALYKQVPNMPLEDVPVGKSEADNKVVKEWGNKPDFDFVPKSHWELAEPRGLIDKQRASKVAGSRFAYIQGDLVLLQFAIVQWTLNILGDQPTVAKIAKDNGLSVSDTSFKPILPPLMLKTDIFEAMDRLEPSDDRYKVGEDGDELWLQGSAEHVMGPIFADEILEESNLPVRLVGYATSFRREAGTYGKDTEGIIRMHQFDKLEMESFTVAEDGRSEHQLMVAIQEYLMQQLGIPYNLVQKCTADIGKPNAVGVDIDAWMPGQDKYKETHTADYMGDYQSRRLKTRVRRQNGEIELVHTNDATAFALGRIMVAIIENNQTADGTIVVPEVLRPFMGGKERI